MAVMRQDIEKRPYQIKALSGHVRDLEDRTYPLTDELRCSVDSVFTVLDEDRDFSCPRRL